LYEFLILQERGPELTDLPALDILPQDIPFIGRMLAKYYQEGEPLFFSSETEDLDEITPHTSIRGKNVKDLIEEIQSQYVHLGQGDIPELNFPDLILNAGYTFSESLEIAKAIENRGIYIIRRLVQDEKVVKAFRTILQNSETLVIFRLLNWEKFLPQKTKETHEFCINCGLPLKQAFMIVNDGKIEEVCEICQDLPKFHGSIQNPSLL
jgi:hypothetical protein